MSESHDLLLPTVFQFFLYKIKSTVIKTCQEQGPISRFQGPRELTSLKKDTKSLFFRAGVLCRMQDATIVY